MFAYLQSVLRRFSGIRPSFTVAIDVLLGDWQPLSKTQFARARLSKREFGSNYSLGTVTPGLPRALIVKCVSVMYFSFIAMIVELTDILILS
jgi:hypothetical protein